MDEAASIESLPVGQPHPEQALLPARERSARGGNPVEGDARYKAGHRSAALYRHLEGGKRQGRIGAAVHRPTHDSREAAIRGPQAISTTMMISSRPMMMVVVEMVIAEFASADSTARA